MQIMYESFKEDTSSINKKIILFIKNNLLKNKDYFDSILLNAKTEEENTEEEEINNEEDKGNKKKSLKKQKN